MCVPLASAIPLCGFYLTDALTHTLKDSVLDFLIVASSIAAKD